MAFDREHLLLSFGGTHFQTEQWTANIRLAWEAPSVYTDATFEAALQDAAADVAAFVGTPALTAASSLDFVKLNRIDPATGKYANTTKTFAKYYTTPVKGTGGIIHAPQVAHVASLVTAAARGRASKGRLFLPAGPFSIEPTGLVTVVQAEARRSQVVTLINNLNNWPGIDASWGSPRVAVMSDIGAGATRYVTGVRVGRVLDTQRRRRKQLDELYTATAAVT